MSGLKDAAFWFRQIANLAVWWLTLEAVYQAAARLWTGSPITPAAVLKILVFGLLAAVLAWRWPPAVKGAPPLWWVRLALVVALWFVLVGRIGDIIATAWQEGAVGFGPIGSAMVMAVVVAAVTWLLAPRKPLTGD